MALGYQTLNIWKTLAQHIGMQSFHFMPCLPHVGPWRTNSRICSEQITIGVIMCPATPVSPPTCNERDYCNHGYRFGTGEEERKTIHAIINQNGLVRILHFSNPNVDYQGEPTGVFGDYPAYNAQIIRNTGCPISAYVASPEVRAIIGGPPKLCGGINGTFSETTYYANILQPAQGFPGQPPYTVSWWWNETGVFTYQAPDEFLGTGNQITLTDVPACNYFTLHIRVVSDDGVYFTASKIVFTGLCSECTEEERVVKTVTHKLPHGQAIKIFPNPTSGAFTAEVHAEEEVEAVFSISSIDGKIRHDLGKYQLSKGPNKISFTLNSLPDGLYTAHFVSSERKYMSLISLQKSRP